MKQIVFSAILLLLVLLNGCRILDKPEEVPSFIYVESFNLQTTSLEGSSSNKITDVWVYIDDNIVGMWELPATIPLHFSGNHKVALYAGIKKNGAVGTRVKYPFYLPFTQNMELIRDSTIIVVPTIQYESGLTFWVEDFEDPGIKFFKYTTSDTAMIIVSSPTYTNLYEGNAGAIFMDASNVLAEMRTNELSFNNFPTLLDVPAYIEMDYKCNNEFYVGILHKGNGSPSYQTQNIIKFNPTTDANGTPQWNKTYLYIPDATNFYPSATDFDIFITGFNNTAIDGIEIFVDNVKVIFRQ